MNGEKSCIIAGGGIGGTAVGALLAHEGYEVKLFDKNTIIGGRCTTYEHEGFKIDLGVHLFGVGGSGYLGDVCRRIGMLDAIQWVLARDPRPILNYCGKRQAYSRDAMSGMVGEGEKEREKKRSKDSEISRKFWKDCMTMDQKSIEELYYTPLSDLVWRYTTNPMLLMFATTICAQYFVIDPFSASAGEFVRCFQQVTKARSSAYPLGGCISIPEAYVRGIKKYGGEVELNARVKKIIVEDDRAKGIELKDGTTYFSDIIISNADIQNTVINLVGEKYFDAEYVNKIKKLTYSLPVLGIKVALDEKVTDQKLIMYMPASFENASEMMPKEEGEPPEKFAGMITSPTNFDPNLAPKGKQLIFFGTYGVPGLTRKEYERWGEACLNSLIECIPEIEGHVMWYRTDGPDVVDAYAGEGGNVIGVAQTVEQIHERRPSQATPIKGLYIVGAEAGGHGIGTELAANSAMELADAITGK